MRRLVPKSLMLAGALTAYSESAAQLVYVGARAGAGIPTGTFADTLGGSLLSGAAPGIGYGLDAGVSLGPLLGLYAGYDHIAFDCVDRLCASNGKYSLTGFSAGIRAGVPFFPLMKPWAKAGVSYNRLAGRGAVANENLRTKKKPGFELGAGVDIPIAQLFSLTPQVRYVRQNLEFDGTASNPAARGKKRADYYTFDIGLRLRSPI